MEHEMSRLTIVRYTVKPDAVGENESLSHAVFDRVRREQPKGIAYGLFKEADGQSFVHVFVNLLGDTSDPVTATPEFDAFQAEISKRCIVPPDVTRLDVAAVDSFGFAIPAV
jgi:hypothetical protein